MVVESCKLVLECSSQHNEFSSFALEVSLLWFSQWETKTECRGCMSDVGYGLMSVAPFWLSMMPNLKLCKPKSEFFC